MRPYVLHYVHGRARAAPQTRARSSMNDGRKMGEKVLSEMSTKCRDRSGLGEEGARLLAGGLGCAAVGDCRKTSSPIVQTTFCV